MESGEPSEEKKEKLRQLQGTVYQYRQWVDDLYNKYHPQYPEAVQSTKKLYIGNIPNDTSEDELSQWIVSIMEECGLKYDVSQQAFPIVSCKIFPHTQKLDDSSGSNDPPPSITTRYAFLQLRNPEDASNFMGLDGIEYKGKHLKMRRPSNYDPNTAMMVGPTGPNPALDFSKVNIIKTFVADSPHKIFVGGLPYEWDDDKVKELLLPFGKLEAFYLAIDKYTGSSRGYAFCEYKDTSITDQAIRALHGQFLNGKVLTVKRALSR